MTKVKNRRFYRAIGRLSLSASLAGFLFATSFTQSAFAGPGGARARRGDVDIRYRGNRTIIRASDGSIISFRNFNIGKNEIVRFIQPGEFSTVLNRIYGDNPTFIRGILRSNGIVYIVNPAGVYFTKNATVNVGGIYAAAGALGDRRFINGIDKFTNLTGEVVNRGDIYANQVHLMGNSVENTGSIQANRGVVTMLAGDKVLIRQHGERITIKVDGQKLNNQDYPQRGRTTPDLEADPGVSNSGSIQAKRGNVTLGAGDMYAFGIHNSGSIEAAYGEITVAAKDGVIENAGKLSTSVERGTAGNVIIQGPSIVNSGEISADANNGRAGYVEVTSQNHTYMTEGSDISAAGGDGHADGGEVLIHSYKGLTVHTEGAHVDVSGGKQGGKGGFAEISGEELIFNGSADVGAKQEGQEGTLLLDPRDIRIENNGTHDGFLGDGIIDFNEGGTNLDIAISDEAIEAVVGHVILQASRDLFVNYPINLVNNNDLTFEAKRHMEINRPITGANNMFLNADADLNGSGTLLIDASLSGILGDATFHGANIILDGGTVISAGTQTYDGPVTLGSSMVFNSPLTKFNYTVNAENSGLQSLTTTGGVEFHGRVGDNTALRSIRILGTSLIDTDVVTTTSTQRYFGSSVVSEDSVMTASKAFFFSTLDSQGVGNYGLDIVGDALFDGKVGGNAAMEYLTVSGSSRINGGLVKSTGIQRYDGAVTLGDDTNMFGSSVTFNSTVDGIADGSQSLKVGGDVYFGDSVGANKRLERLTSLDSATIDINGGLINTLFDQRYWGPVVVTSDAILRGSGIRFFDTVDSDVWGTNDLVIDGDMSILDVVGGVNPLSTLLVTGESSITGGLVRTTGTQTYLGRVGVGSTQKFTGSVITFDSTLDAGTVVGNDAVIVDGDAVFNDKVGARHILVFLKVLGSTSMAAGEVWTKQTQQYHGLVTLGSDNMLTSTENYLILFGNTVDGAFDLFVRTGGITKFLGTVGGTTPLTLLHTDAPGAAAIGADMFANALLFDDRVRLLDNVALTGFDIVNFGSTIAADGNDLLVNSPLTNFNGAVYGAGHFETDADGVTNVNGPFIRARSIAMHDAINLMQNTRMRADEFALFGSTIDGAFGLGVYSGGTVFFGGNVGSATPLTSLLVEAGDVITVDANLFDVLGDINLDGGRGFLTGPEIATIAGTGGDLVMRSRDGRFIMGNDNRFSVLGDLHIDAALSATLGDLSTLGDMVVDAPNIRILTRDRSRVRNSDGGIDRDVDVDFIAGGKIRFRTTPTLLGFGSGPIFATRDGSGIGETLDGFTKGRSGRVNSDRFFFGSTVLDLVPVVGGDNLAEGLGDDIPEDSKGRVRDRVLLDPIAMRNLQRMGIFLREMQPSELLAVNDRGIVYNDSAQGLDPATQQQATLVNRLRRPSVLRALTDFRIMFYGEDAPADVDFADLTDRSTEIQSELSSALASNSGNMEVLLSSLESEDNAQIRTYVDTLRGIMADLRISGLSAAEMNRSRIAILGPVIPEGVTIDQMREMIEDVALGGG